MQNQTEFRDLLPAVRLNGAPAWVKRLTGFSARSTAVEDPPRKPHTPRYITHGRQTEVIASGEVEDPGELLDIANEYLG